MVTSQEKKELLLPEMQRVLENQFQIIQEQRTQAVHIININIAAIGLILTAFSIAFTTDIVSTPDLEEFIGSILMIVLIGVILIIVLLALFAPALGVLSSTNRAFMFSPKLFLGLDPQEDYKTRAADDFVRIGIDATKAEELYKDVSSISDGMIEYNIESIKENEKMIRNNQINLSLAYSSILTMIFCTMSFVFYFVLFYDSYGGRVALIMSIVMIIVLFWTQYVVSDEE